jgi:hypothetical protein
MFSPMAGLHAGRDVVFVLAKVEPASVMTSGNADNHGRLGHDQDVFHLITGDVLPW